MKNLILTLMCLAFVAMAYSQRVIKLEELNLDYNPKSLEIDGSSNSLSFNVSEDYIGQFHSNPLRFAKENFNIMDFIEANQDKDYDTYTVTFITNKGNLKVNYNAAGKIQSSSQRFKDINLPYYSLISVLRANEGYSLVGTKHLAYSKDGWALDEEFYKVKLQNGNKSKTVKLNVDRDARGVAVATIE
ncbi:hypothetical protein [Salegentibacter sp. Hel_I_6]|uniref:hypothetical protein n=1 Tax=Salegentibacter sp. Hel_I_6 TaxID=1250278 RepID=UPI00056C7664|nr:hypothetical protein [Salegentibacter sp. Hel_I_6]